jgi:hypothetical protein
MLYSYGSLDVACLLAGYNGFSLDNSLAAFALFAEQVIAECAVSEQFTGFRNLYSFGGTLMGL